MRGLTIQEFLGGYRSGSAALADLIELRRALDETDPAFISLVPVEQVTDRILQLERLREKTGDPLAHLPLFGVPFAVKDNIDVLGLPTTAACPALGYVATASAFSVELLERAGAVVIAKTNLDQLATGLVGTRSPYGVVPNPFDDGYIGGGSSSGSASVVARGLVPFALGTDTAGSGRVPAAFTNTVGWKPTRGRISARGVVPACRTLDCVSVFALNVADARLVAEILDVFDAEDPYARRDRARLQRVVGRAPRIGFPAHPQFLGDEAQERVVRAALEEFVRAGFELHTVDEPAFDELRHLLYAGPWVTERILTAGNLLDALPEHMDPVVRGILLGGRGESAEAAFLAEYRRAELARRIDRVFDAVDALVVPTTPTIYRIAEVAADPLGTNANLGTYTNFTNLADLSAVAVPAGFRSDGLPAGVTFLGRAQGEWMLADLAERFLALAPRRQGASPRVVQDAHSAELGADWMRLAVFGAHMSGMPLSPELAGLGGVLLETRHTSSRYRMYVRTDLRPVKPGVVRGESGAPIELELWALPIGSVGAFVAGVGPPLGIGSVELNDGSWVKGFIAEPSFLEGAVDITSHGGFRSWLSSALPAGD